MNRLILFVKKIYVFVLFVVLEIVALNYYASSTSYTKAKLLTTSNKIAGGVHHTLSDVGDYFSLRSENKMLLESIARLQTELENIKLTLPDTTTFEIPEGETEKYLFMPASVINNSTSKQENFITIDKGELDGIKIKMALITPDGCIAGYVLDCDDNFSVAISVLNIKFRTGGKIKNKDFYGSVKWDGIDNEYVTLTEIPKYADIIIGDTIVTGHSSIFPSDITIGTVESFELTQSSYYDIKVKLGTRLAKLNNVMVIDYSDLQERLLLEENYF